MFDHSSLQSWRSSFKLVGFPAIDQAFEESPYIFYRVEMQAYHPEEPILLQHHQGDRKRLLKVEVKPYANRGVPLRKGSRAGEYEIRMPLCSGLSHHAWGGTGLTSTLMSGNYLKGVTTEFSSFV
ncbi:hypothetical protein CRENBAI_014462 [Crenichthys baileyi]|uniref:Uncharacterized protein n=1 Tax=Crenichthys baileyi TaxID=28760 RepID=A0AAV9QRH1_9TELE